MKKLKTLFAVLTLVVLTHSPSAALDTPVLTVTTSGLNVTISWTMVAGATEYNLIYAPYPYTDPNTIQFINMGTLTNLNVDLWDGAAFYLAVSATLCANMNETLTH